MCLQHRAGRRAGDVPGAGRIPKDSVTRCPAWHHSHSPYVISWSAFRVKGSWDLLWWEGKAPGLHPGTFWSLSTGRKPRGVGEEALPSSGETRWEKQYFHKDVFPLSTHISTHLGQLREITNVSEGPPNDLISQSHPSQDKRSQRDFSGRF